ncbi:MULTISPECIES: DNA-3-methyladenine glycosylase I [unclassified Ruegeria]|uniref:DNA-3-methyladenine glycosylase I n=1 Tax=unclassified Ruegeria TaxID=2625375 RepID=UPI00148A0BA0|nr:MULTISPECIES: DNA-3-methyladenine glycosylase I [unclassified Ruegeria]NOD48294.1 3-methyladenine DNA glycosylase [Ruegeria sp. HKCCD5849]NOD52314.1 3-methyladenine DNA glycosylase [Ruegeria sp. HKCCD5851]NOD68417.1 3-methyladenine DNA glycosylase [Ruegeria sp. HKCCD7303]NOE34776.1 3-methyladenine DNA glycosylase [Ruegeria sp. HKCCD7318]
MRTFDEIFDISASRHGGPDALQAMLHKPKSPEELAAIPEDRWLAMLTKCVFQAGFNWKVIENKWDGFEVAFDGFDVGRCAFMDDEKFDALLQDKRIVRNGTKIAAVRDNAAFLMELREEGGAGKVLGGWPSADYINLLALLAKRGSRLGGASAQYAMRFIGRDSFILSQDVTARLIAEGVIDKPATSKKAMLAVQKAFNTWMDQSGRSLTEISRVLAMSL